MYARHNTHDKYTIPYHIGPSWPRFATNNADILVSEYALSCTCMYR